MYRGALAFTVVMLCACASPPLDENLDPPAAGGTGMGAPGMGGPAVRGAEIGGTGMRGAESADDDPPLDSGAPTACAPPRPEVCTMVYEPVCATLADNLAQSQYSSACNACADDRVVAYREGPCE